MPDSSRDLLWKRVLEAIENAKPRTGADYYKADTANGDHMDDPSEDGLFMLLDDLEQANNAFMVITPADSRATWHASVTLRADGTYEVERSDPGRSEQHRHTATRLGEIARDLTIWLAARDKPGRPISRPSSDS
jgi:hypothetical protein